MTTPKPPMLLPPTLVENPSPLHVSTFAKPEYADLTFTYGRVKSGGSWPVHCKSFTVSIPTGRQASALTSEPSLIHYKLTVPAGRLPWAVEADTRDPNQVVFTCSPPPGEPAAFDGTWSVELKLWGIEVNGGAGAVEILWEESTSATGPEGPYQERSGKGTVNKRDDSFYLHSFRPDSVAIKRGNKPTLKWEGTPHAAYTMYYRKPDGTQGSATAKDGSWQCPVDLVDDSCFILEAKMGNEVRYLTTYIKINAPDIAVTSMAAEGNVTVDPGNNGYIWLKTGRLDIKDTAGLNVYGGAKFDAALAANGDVTVASSKTLTVKTIKSPADKLTIESGIVDIAGGAAVSGSLAANSALSVNGAFTANQGTTSVWGWHGLDAPSDGYPKVATAPTDGILDVRTNSGTLQIGITRPGNSGRTFVVVAGNHESFSVPKGWKVELRWSGSKGTAFVDWYGFGGQRLPLPS
ncbi:hypothetical protein [Streptomyces sp. CBMA123]|uniref:hypothetical protein n=1 Tax=Streptomyces sp. CBMA123 TaxID=1896313 RepID=UPI001661AE9F|nr:hypothetical protein [Streptomyces sp. CBMA123]MBD0693566.1 hypothetical protein [Streptomyces sp. CBMA123]